MDSLIIRHFELLNEYAALQTELSTRTSAAFISLSRARYNGIDLSTERYRPDLNCFVSVKIEDSAKQESRKVPAEVSEQDPTEANTTENGNEVYVKARIRVVDKDSGDSASAAGNISDTDTDEGVETTEDQDLRELTYILRELEITGKKKDNPMRDIEALPSQTLRNTQSAFHAMLRSTVRLANVFAELQLVQELLQLHDIPPTEAASEVSDIEPKPGGQVTRRG